MMYRTCQPLVTKAILLIFTFVSALGFSSRAGGISFEIYLNDQLLLKQQYRTVISGSPVLDLENAKTTDNLKIFFRSCGASAKTRSVGVRDENNKLVKEWTFASTTATDLAMTIPVKEILALQKGKSSSLKLFYFSPEQFPDGEMLASLPSGKRETAVTGHQDMETLPMVAGGLIALVAIGLFVRKIV